MDKNKKFLLKDFLISDEIEGNLKTKINLYIKNKPNKEIKYGILINFIGKCDEWANDYRSYLKDSKKYEKENKEIIRINDENHEKQVKIYEENIENIFGFKSPTLCKTCNENIYQRLDIDFPFTLMTCKNNHGLWYIKTATIGSNRQKQLDHWGEPCSYVHKGPTHLEWQQEYFTKNAKKKSIPKKPKKPNPKLKKASKPTKPFLLLDRVHFDRYKFTYPLIIIAGILIGIIYILI